MQKKNEERKNYVKIKEVITALCKLLSALGVESVPNAEVFRRAKFNKTDAVSSPWLPETYYLQQNITRSL